MIAFTLTIILNFVNLIKQKNITSNPLRCVNCYVHTHSCCLAINIKIVAPSRQLEKLRQTIGEYGGEFQRKNGEEGNNYSPN